MGLNYHDHLEEAAFLAGKPKARIPGYISHKISFKTESI
jgi:hypothetical protein